MANFKKGDRVKKGNKTGTAVYDSYIGGEGSDFGTEFIQVMWDCGSRDASKTKWGSAKGISKINPALTT